VNLSRIAKIACHLILGKIVSGIVVIIYLFTSEPDRDRFPIRGIDVSHQQGHIDWIKVARDDVAFAYLKASEGVDVVDSHFKENSHAAEDAGIKVGAYHLFTFCHSGKNQAAVFLQVAGKQKQKFLPAVYLEFAGNCARQPSPSELKIELDSFVHMVEETRAKPVVIYVTAEAFHAYQDVLPHRPIWLRSLSDEPGQNNWALWQYDSAGRVAGIEGRVGLNLFCGSMEAFNLMVSQATYTGCGMR